MARKGTNKTGPRNRNGSAKKAFATAAHSASAKFSNLSARLAVAQLATHGYLVQGFSEKQSGLTAKQKQAVKWVRGETGAQHPRVSQTGSSFYLAHISGAPELIMPVGNMLSYEAVYEIQKITGVALAPAHGKLREAPHPSMMR